MAIGFISCKYISVLRMSCVDKLVERQQEVKEEVMLDIVDINDGDKDNECNEKNPRNEYLLRWTQALHGPSLSWLVCLTPSSPFLHPLHSLFVIVSLLLSWYHYLTILVSAMLENLTLYLCYCPLWCNYVSLVVDRAAVLAAFMNITGFSNAKTINLMFFP